MRLQTDAAIEFRRQMILNLRAEGKSQQAIADLVNLNQSKVSLFLSTHAVYGDQSIKAQKAKGNVARLDTAQLETLKQYLEQGAVFHGYEGDYWDRKRVKNLIEDKFSISYTSRHVGNILKKINYTLQKYTIKDYRQSAEKVSDFLDNQVPIIKKKLNKRVV